MGCRCLKATGANNDNNNIVYIYPENENTNDPSAIKVNILNPQATSLAKEQKMSSFGNNSNTNNNKYNKIGSNIKLSVIEESKDENKILSSNPANDNRLSVISAKGNHRKTEVVVIEKNKISDIINKSPSFGLSPPKLDCESFDNITLNTNTGILSKINSYKDKISRILSFNGSNQLNNTQYQILEYNKNKLNASNIHSNNFNNLFTQSGIFEHSDTRGKTYSKSLMNTTSLNTTKLNFHFSLELLKELNSIRKNPISYSDKIKEFMKYINTDEKTQRKFFLVNKNTKINLLRGEEAFLECLNFIKDFDKEIKNLKKNLCELEIREELKFPFPNEEPEKCIDKEYIKQTLASLKKNLQKDLKIKGFHYDLSTNDAEISAILQIVDDNNSCGKRRSMLLEETVKYVGINIGRLKDNLYCIYLVFAA